MEAFPSSADEKEPSRPWRDPFCRLGSFPVLPLGQEGWAHYPHRRHQELLLQQDLAWLLGVGEPSRPVGLGRNTDHSLWGWPASSPPGFWSSGQGQRVQNALMPALVVGPALWLMRDLPQGAGSSAFCAALCLPGSPQPLPAAHPAGHLVCC